MQPSTQSPRADAPAGRGTGNGFAWASFLLSLVFPLTYGFVVVYATLANRVPSGANPFVAALYTVFDYIEWPLPLLAVMFGHIALARGSRASPLALIGLALGYLSILGLLGLVLALAISGAVNQH